MDVAHYETRIRSWLQQLGHPAPWAVLAASLLFTALATIETRKEVEIRLQLQLDKHADSITQTIRSRLVGYQSILRGGLGLLQASERVSRQEWQQYYEQLHLNESFPGMQGFGYSILIPATHRQATEETVRQEGFAGFRIRPEGNRPIYSSIIFLEPFDWRNQRAFGYDMYSEPVRRAAMDQAMLTGEPAISGKVFLMQETEKDKQAGFLMYLAFYGTAKGLNTPEERRAATKGFVYAPFRINDLLDSMIGKNRHPVNISIYDQERSLAQRLYHSSTGRLHGNAPTATRTVSFGQHNWIIDYEAGSEFPDSADSMTPWLVMFGGMASGFILFMLNLAYLNAQSRERLTRELMQRQELSEQRFRALFNEVPLALLAVNESGMVEHANQRAMNLFGMNQDQLLKAAVEELMPQEFRQHHRQLRNSYAIEPKARSMANGRTLHAMAADGALVPVEIGLSPLPLLQGSRLTVVALIDLREREKAKQDLDKLMQQLQQKNKELEQFVFTISHDLRAPLVTIKGFTAQLQRSIGNNASDDQIRWISRIAANADSLDVRLRELLHLSRTAHEPMQQDPVDLDELVRHATELLTMSIRDNDATVVVRSPLGIVRGHRGLLLDCIQNLMTNSLKYRSKESPVIEIFCSQDKDCISLHLRDNGIGIATEHQKRIFDIFERLDPGSVDGNGVGLAIVKTIMEKHGGSITVVSSPGQGATFILHFPLSPRTENIMPERLET